MKWFGIVKDIFKPAAELIDELHTSEDEKLQAKARLNEIMNAAEIRLAEIEIDVEREVTERHANDMKSDSWLSKNIRPMGLIFALVNLWLIAWATIFVKLSESQLGLAQVWIPLLVGLVGAMVGFYYSWRGAEKITKIKQQ